MKPILSADLLQIATEEFLQEQRPSRHVALLLHDANCPHCRKALPELDHVAKALTKEDVPGRMAGDWGRDDLMGLGALKDEI